jgi:hypothetical protein
MTALFPTQTNPMLLAIKVRMLAICSSVTQDGVVFLMRCLETVATE